MGLDVVGEAEVAPANDMMKRVSMIAARTDGVLAGPLYQRRDLFFAASAKSGLAAVAVVEHSIKRERNRVTSEFVVRYADPTDPLASEDTPAGGIVIEHVTVLTFDDFDAYVRSAQDKGEPLQIDDLISADSFPHVIGIEKHARVTDPQGRSIEYLPGEATLPEVLAQLGDGCGNCYLDCFTQHDYWPGPGDIICLVEWVIWCVPACVTPLTCGVCLGSVLGLCGLAYTIPHVAEISWCLVVCWFSNPCDYLCAECNYCHVDTEYENNCPVSWFGNGYCDCGCQFGDIDCW